MTVCVPFAPIWSLPDSGSEQVDEILFGDETEILEEDREFCKIKTEYGYFGWIKKSNLHQTTQKPNHRISVPFADLLFERKNYFSPAMALPFGAKVCAEEPKVDDRYCKVFLPNGSVCFIHKNHISPIDSTPKTETRIRKDLAETAKEYLGVQYRWGGRTMSGVDCSGLCFNSYRFNNIPIWRDAHIEKSPVLRKIDAKDACLGDLIFFKGHVAMCLDDGYIIHATASKGKTVIEKLDENEYLKQILICAGTLF